MYQRFVIKHDPKNDWAYFKLGSMYAAKDPDTAIRYLNRAEELNPSIPLYDEELAIAFDNKFKISEKESDENEPKKYQDRAQKLRNSKMSAISK